MFLVFYVDEAGESRQWQILKAWNRKFIDAC